MRNDRRAKINFLIKSSGQDEYGSPTDIWTAFKSNIYASKKPILGNEYFTAMTTGAKVEVKFNTRYFEGVTNSMLIQQGNVKYEILSAIDVDDLHRELLCYCKLVT